MFFDKSEELMDRSRSCAADLDGIPLIMLVMSDRGVSVDVAALFQPASEISRQVHRRWTPLATFALPHRGQIRGPDDFKRLFARNTRCLTPTNYEHQKKTM